MTDPSTIRRQCQHIKDNGEQCKNNSMPGRRFCYVASHCGDAPLEAKVRNFFQNNLLWIVLVGIFTLVVAIPTLYGYLTRISVEPYSTVRSHEPLGTVFNLKNNGIFDLHDV